MDAHRIENRKIKILTPGSLEEAPLFFYSLSLLLDAENRLRDTVCARMNFYIVTITSSSAISGCKSILGRAFSPFDIMDSIFYSFFLADLRAFKSFLLSKRGLIARVLDHLERLTEERKGGRAQLVVPTPTPIPLWIRIAKRRLN